MDGYEAMGFDVTRMQIASKKPYLPSIIKAKPSILILPKFKPKVLFFGFLISWLDNYKIFIWKIMVLWGYSPLIYSQTSNWKSNSEIYKCEFIKQVVSRWFKLWKNQFLGFLSSHKKGTLLTFFHIHSLLVFHTDLQKNTIVTCILTEQNHIFYKYAG